MSAPTITVNSTVAAPDGGAIANFTASYSGYQTTRDAYATPAAVTASNLATAGAAAANASATTWAAYIDSLSS